MKRKREKKAQVMLFIVMAIVITVIISFLFFYSGIQKEKIKEKENSKTNLIKIFVQKCLDKTSKEGIYLICLQGGYYNPGNSVKVTYYSVPTHFSKNKVEIPNSETFQRELKTYIEKHFEECVDFDSLNLSGNITTKKPVANVLINKNNKNIKINLIYPITIETGESKIFLDKFEKSIEFNFNYIYNVLEELKLEYAKNPDFIIAGKISDLADKNNFTFELLYLEDNFVVYSLKLNAGLEEPCIFSIGAKYDW